MRAAIFTWLYFLYNMTNEANSWICDVQLKTDHKKN